MYVRYRAERLWCGFFLIIGAFFLLHGAVQAENLRSQKVTISTSVPGADANHTLEFNLATAVPAGAVFRLDFPTDFTVAAVSESSFSTRNVEVLVNGIARTATATADATTDGVSITSGAGGSIEYTLNSTTGIADGATVEWKIGNHTSGSLGQRTVVLGTSSTTTLPADIIPINNSNATGTHILRMSTTGVTEPVGGDFVIFLNDQVGIGPVDTTEDIPPFRFNGAPASSTSGTTANVEISLETDEFAQCRYATTASTSYAVMPNDFNSSGLVVHTRVIAVTPDTNYTFYVRCSDDEGNENIDDYVIEFYVPPEPDGETNENGNNNGDGSGPNDTGSGGGTGTGAGSGGTGNGGGSQSSGGGGGGSGGGSGSGSSGGSGGGFENDGPYESGDGEVTITGDAWPGADIVVLVDGQEAETGRANSSGEFSVTLEEIARGVYSFGIYAEDDNGVKSSTFSTSFTVSGARATRLSNINISGTVEVVPDPVPLDGSALVRGYTLPNASVTLENRIQGGSSATTLFATSDANGFYSTTLAAAGLARGTYEIRVKAEQDGGESTEFSDWNFYGIGQEADVPINADLNRDGRVNLIDFSILLFWWDTNGGDSDPPADINRDGRVSLTDFSILLFNWTG